MGDHLQKTLFETSPSFLRMIDEIRPGSYDAHSFKSEYSYLCYIALYQFATQFCKEKIVLDAACGLGYGSYLLAQNAEKVTGIEIVASNIEFSQQNYKKDNLSFLVADATAMDFHDDQFDVVVSIETFEHIPPEKALQFLEEFRRVLKPGGTLVISTPNHDIYSQISRTPDHINELNVDDFEALLCRVFKECEPYYQRKGVLQTTGRYYSALKKDKYNLRRFVPHWIVGKIRSIAAPHLQKSMQEILQQVQVHKAENRDEVKDAVVQVWVCKNSV